MKRDIKTSKFIEKVGQIVWPTLLLASVILILLLTIESSAPRFDFTMMD